MNDVMLSSRSPSKVSSPSAWPLIEVDLEQLRARHVAALRDRVLQAVASHEGELAEIVVVLVEGTDCVVELAAFVKYCARVFKVQPEKFHAQLVESLKLGAGDRVAVAVPKAGGEGWWFSSVVVPRLSFGGLR